MRILHVVTLASLGGAQSVVLNLANNMSDKHEVWVAAAPTGDMWTMLNSQVRTIKMKHFVRSISPLKDLLALFALFQLQQKIKPDIIHLHSSKAGILGRLAFPKSKVIYTVHGFDSIRVAYRKFLPLEKLLAHRSRWIVAVSDYDHNNLLLEGIKKRVVTVYNGIKSNTHTTLSSFPNLPHEKTILCIARIDPQKHFALFKNVARLLPQYNFVWIGNKTTPPNLPKNLICMGEIPEASTYYSAAHLCMLPSHYEGLPMTIIEAMSYGLPVVASDVGGISEIVINDWNGYTLVNDPELFAEKISYVLNHPDVYKKMAANSFSKFQSELTADIMVQKYLQLYLQS